MCMEAKCHKTMLRFREVKSIFSQKNVLIIIRIVYMMYLKLQIYLY